MDKEKKTLWQEFNDLGGMPLWLYVLCSAIILAVMVTGRDRFKFCVN